MNYKLLARILLVFIFVYEFIEYQDYKNNSKTPINYTCEKMFVQTSRSGVSHVLIVYYNNTKYRVLITKNDYDKLKSVTVYPKLYHSNLFDFVFSEYEMKMIFRVMALIIVMFLITFIPFNKISNHLDAQIKIKDKRLMKSVEQTRRQKVKKKNYFCKNKI